MNDNLNNPNFDWVSARSACSLKTIFETLKLEVEKDVEIRNRLRPAMAHYVFKMVSKADVFTVFVESNKAHPTTKFSLSNDSIQLRDGENNLRCDAVLTLNNNGECRLRVHEREYTFWQFRRMALESMFFFDLE
jgi:hypothetical protein